MRQAQVLRTLWVLVGALWLLGCSMSAGAQSPAAPVAPPAATDGDVIAPASLTEKIWYEFILANISTGYDTAEDQFTERNLYLSIVGPANVRWSAPGELGFCAKVAGIAAGKVITAKVDSLLPKTPEQQRVEATATDQKTKGKTKKAAPPAPLPPAVMVQNLSVAEVEAKRRDQLNAIMVEGLSTFEKSLRTCDFRLARAGTFKLGLVQRRCDGQFCDKRQASFAQDTPTLRFSLMADWAASRAGQVDAPQLNEVSLIGMDATKNPFTRILGRKADEATAKACAAVAQSLRPANLNCVAVASAGKKVLEGNLWGTQPPAEQLQREFEALVVKARAERAKIEQSVARSINLPQQLALRMLDAIDMPSMALTVLPVVDGAQFKTNLQDEIARMRIKECVLRRGQTEPDKASKCAGYELPSKAEIDACVLGGKCLPKIGAVGWPDVMAMTDLAAAYRVGESLLPRVGGKAPLEQTLSLYQKTYEECVKSSATKEQGASCLLDGKLGPDVQQAYACVKGGETGSATLTKEQFSCLTKGKLPLEVSKPLACLDGPGTDRQRYLCALGDKVPDKARQALACQEQAKGDSVQLAACMTGVATGSADAGLLAKCLQESNNDQQAAAVCFASNKAPKELQLAMKCAGEAGYTAIALCAAQGTNVLPPEVGKVMACAAQSGGDPFGTGICVASNADGLTPDQRIALQCAMSSGGEPTTFATCAGGRLLVKEMFNCIDKKLFEDKCVGEGNEIRKFFTMLGVDLKSSTVVGQVLNFPLDALKWQVATLQSFAKGVEDFGQNVDREFGNLAKRAGEAVKPLTDVVANTTAELVRAGENVGEALSGAAKRGEQVVHGIGDAINHVFGW